MKLMFCGPQQIQSGAFPSNVPNRRALTMLAVWWWEHQEAWTITLLYLVTLHLGYHILYSHWIVYNWMITTKATCFEKASKRGVSSHVFVHHVLSYFWTNSNHFLRSSHEKSPFKIPTLRGWLEISLAGWYQFPSICINFIHHLLVGGDWNMNFMTFHSVGNVIIPTDFHSIIFQRVGWNHQPVCVG